MTRVDLYGAVHKAIRALLFEAVVVAGRTEFTEALEREEALRLVRRLIGFLDEHAEHEDEILMPEFASIAPDLHAQLQADHARTDGLQREISALVERISGATAPERESLGRRLRERLVQLVVLHLEHMEREETAGNRALWAHRSDEELGGLHGRILGRIPPGRMGEWLEVILPVLTGPERRELDAAASVGGARS